MQFAAKSDVGLVRKVNQDGFWMVKKETGVILAAVADGMGGHVAGEVASSLALTSMSEYLSQKGIALTEQTLMEAIHFANGKVFRESQEKPDLRGMGTTMVACIAMADQIVIGHVGDSRAYLFSQKEGLTLLTQDHSLVNELVKRGQILPFEAAKHPQRHMLTMALGTTEQIEPECRTYSWGSDDQLLLCSDGLTGCVEEEAIAQVLHQSIPLQEKVDALITRALESGGTDNITVLTVSLEDEIVRGNRE